MFNLNIYLVWFFMVGFFSLFVFLVGLYFCMLDYSAFFEFKLVSLNSVYVYYVIYLDSYSIFFISLVMFISSLVVLYSCQYMGYMSFSSVRFLFLVLMFVFSMILMIISPNLLSIMLGWDGLGLVSYVLVIYYGSVKSYLSGLITCLTNRLGDIGLLVSICWVFNYGGWHFMFFNGFMSGSIFFLVIFSSFTSSAQIPFSCWLPAAMAAPTPVSSLVHSSTLVTAGVYLMIRFFSDLFMSSYLFLFVGLITMVFSSLCANYEFDLKKIIALSTLSQLGLMVTSLFIGLSELSFFHLLTHALFKSLLFLCSGIFIYYMLDNQDIRLMGSVCLGLPLTTACFNIANMALCGIPFLSGFYSKDLIVEYSVFMGLNSYVFIIFYLSLGMTCCYSFRLFYYTMVFNNKFITFSYCIDSLDFMKLSVLTLSFFSVFFGCVFSWLMSYDMVFVILPFYIKIMTLFSVFLGVFIGLELFSFNYLFSLNFYFFNSFMWFMNGHLLYLYNFMYNYVVCLDSLNYWGEFYGGYGISYALTHLSSLFQGFFLSSFKVSLLSFFIWLILVFC